jgi:hypothetical protein
MVFSWVRLCEPIRDRHTVHLSYHHRPTIPDMDDKSRFTLESFILNANMSQLGSYGEAVFHAHCKAEGMEIVPLHVGRADFLVDGRRVDVKTSRKNLAKVLTEPKLLVRNTVEGTDYYMVEFHRAGALLSKDRVATATVPWDALVTVFHRWRAGEFGAKHSPMTARPRKVSAELLQRIRSGFTDRGLAAPYILYRTIMFENESPHNLLPSQRAAKHRLGWTVFLVCRTAPVDETTLDYIIAFPDETDRDFPRLRTFGTSKHIEGLEKADLGRLPEGVRFGSVDELFMHLPLERTNSSAFCAFDSNRECSGTQGRKR